MVTETFAAPHDLLQAVSDPTRLRLLRLLDREELNVQELVRILGMGQPRVSKHLAVLRDTGWIKQRREGTWSWYAGTGKPDFPGGTALYDGVLAAAARSVQAVADDEALAAVLHDRDARTSDFFAGAAARWDEIRRAYERPELHLGAVAALVSPGLRVLDVGTGTGALLPALTLAGCSVTAVDRSAAMLSRARRVCAQEGLSRLAFFQADVQALPFAPGVFDAAFASMVLHHVARPALAVAELARVVCPGGRVALIDFLPHAQTWMREQLAHQWLGFPREEIERWQRQAGLSPLAFQTRPAPSIPLALQGGRRRGMAAWPDVFLAVAEVPAGDGDRFVSSE